MRRALVVAALLASTSGALAQTSPITNPFAGTGISETAISGAPAIFTVSGTVSPPSASTAIDVAIVGQQTYAGSAAINSPGHIIGVLGYTIYNAPSGSLRLGIGVEGKVENDGSGTCTNCESFNANMAANSGVMSNWYGVYADEASNSGAVGVAAAVAIQNDANTGTQTALIGALLPPITAYVSGETVYGLYCSAQTGSFTGHDFCMDNVDPNMPIYNAGLTILGAHLIDSGAAPTLSSCGTSPVAPVGSDDSFSFANGTGTVTSCTATFSAQWVNSAGSPETPTCVATPGSTAGSVDISTISSTAVTFGYSASAPSLKVYVHCFG